MVSGNASVIQIFLIKTTRSRDLTLPLPFKLYFFPLFKKCTRDATDAFPDASIVYYSCKK